MGYIGIIELTLITEEIHLYYTEGSFARLPGEIAKMRALKIFLRNKGEDFVKSGAVN